MSNLPIRRVARVVVLDAANSVLMASYSEILDGRPRRYWVPPGGALEADESHCQAAQRELLEETGLSEVIGQELWTRDLVIQHAKGHFRQIEKYFQVRLRAISPFVQNSSAECIQELRWFPVAEIECHSEVIYPDGFAASLKELISESG
jgi:8-oxo-dGTP pyrophosphatase MutT (NUDIX family)